MGVGAVRTSEVLNKAADLLERHGWTQGAFGWSLEHGRGRLCLEGGILAAQGIQYVAGNGATNKVHHQELVECPAYVAVRDYLDTQMPLWMWNDMTARSQAEVVMVLRAAALVEEAKENTNIEQEISA